MDLCFKCVYVLDSDGVGYLLNGIQNEDSFASLSFHKYDFAPSSVDENCAL